MNLKIPSVNGSHFVSTSIFKRIAKEGWYQAIARSNSDFLSLSIALSTYIYIQNTHTHFNELQHYLNHLIIHTKKTIILKSHPPFSGIRWSLAGHRRLSKFLQSRYPPCLPSSSTHCSAPSCCSWVCSQGFPCWQVTGDNMSMAWYKTTVSPLLTHWRYCSLALNHTMWAYWPKLNPILLSINCKIFAVPHPLSSQAGYVYAIPSQTFEYLCYSVNLSTHQGPLLLTWFMVKHV